MRFHLPEISSDLESQFQYWLIFRNILQLPSLMWGEHSMRDYHCICDQCRTVFVPMDMCICICLQWPNFSHRSCKYEDYPAWGNIGLYLRGIEVCHQQRRFHGIAGEESFQCPGSQPEGRDESQRGSFCCAWPTINRSRRKYVDQLMMQRVSQENKGWDSG